MTVTLLCAGAELPVLRRQHGAEGARALADGPHAARGARQRQRHRRRRAALALRARRTLHAARRQDARRTRHFVLLVCCAARSIYVLYLEQNNRTLRATDALTL